MIINLEQAKKYGSLELLARQMVDGFITGLHKSPYHGFSVEFAEHRLYNYGESTRHIDWKVFARTDRLYTKQYEEETNLRCYLLLDHSSSMHYPLPDKDKLKFSAYASAAISYLLQKQRDAVSLVSFTDQINVETPAKSTATHVQKIFDALTDIIETNSKEEKTDVTSVIHEIAEKINRRSLVVLFSDMFQPGKDVNQIFQSLSHLKHNQHEVLLFHVTDHATELRFDFEDRPYKFIDLETSEVLKLTPTEYKKAYHEEMKRFYSAVKLRAGQLKIDFIPVDIKDDFNKVLASFLVKRSKMK
ncbi:MAG: DUF58 domain-containing protein [Cyclobacteriaceae bacterium]